MRYIFFLVTIFFLSSSISAQLPDSCKLKIGTNLGGLADWGTEVAFVDMMRTSRQWYTKDIGNPNPDFDSGMASHLSYRSDGYPTHIPQSISESDYNQKIVTIWAITDGWEPGNYVILFDGTGTLNFWGNYTNLENPNSNRYTFTMDNPVGGTFEMTIETSDINDPIHNIRIVRDIYESTYLDEPFNPTWIDLLSTFKTVRFMDWGQTNNWGLDNSWEWDDPVLKDWNERAQLNNYTWTTNKGVPYEMMVKLMNDHDLDGWVCVPHSASDNYIQEMARFFRDNLNEDRKLTVEYSNETWNWMFGQTQWLNQYGCIDQGVTWPEGTAPYVQNCLDIWTTEWSSDLDRLTRVVGVQTGWLDVAQRVANNVDSNSFDAVTGTYYFGISETADAILDNLGSSATAQDVNDLVRADWHNEQGYIQDIQNEVAVPLSKGFVFYEGGQHLTAHPFGEMPSYNQALLDIQISPLMYEMYNDWFDFLRTLQSGNEPLDLMNFSFISSRDAQYGSWGVLEYQYQDPTVQYAPKYEAILDNQNFGCEEEMSTDQSIENVVLNLYPNPTNSVINVHSNKPIQNIQIFDLVGKLILSQETNSSSVLLNVASFPVGTYLVKVSLENSTTFKTIKFIKN